jgi:hypothetical protein
MGGCEIDDRINIAQTVGAQRRPAGVFVCASHARPVPTRSRNLRHQRSRLAPSENQQFHVNKKASK